MSKGYSGLFHNTHGTRAVPGNLSLGPNDRYHTYIAKRSDIDTDGYFDIIAHGSSKTIEIVHNGISKPIDHRVAARLFKNKPELINKPIRLLSCNTGRISHGFAQGLADRLNVPVIAPTDYIWANPDGTHFIAAGKTVAGKLVPIRNKPGKFKTFYPHKKGEKRI